MAKIIFENVNEDGQVYGVESTIEDALKWLLRFPNDTIVVSIVEED
jgi:hypothetical protein